jgi:hypothetical protein
VFERRQIALSCAFGSSGGLRIPTAWLNLCLRAPEPGYVRVRPPMLGGVWMIGTEDSPISYVRLRKSGRRIILLYQMAGLTGLVMALIS